MFPINSENNTMPDIVENRRISLAFIKKLFQEDVGLKADSTDEGHLVIQAGSQKIIAEIHADGGMVSGIRFCSLWLLDKKVSENRRYRFCNHVNRTRALIRGAIDDDSLILDYWIDVRQGLSPPMLVSTVFLFVSQADGIIREAAAEGLLE